MKNVKSNKRNIKPNLLSRTRKGSVDVQFNWIFVLIAGFVIFLFIISIAFSQKRSAENQAGIDTINHVTTLLKGRQQTANMYSEITLPRTDMSFVCDPAAPEYFNFKIGNSRTQLPVDIIFAPEQMTTNKMMVWSQSFTLGFPVGIFSYITTADSVILIYNDSTTTNKYAKQLSNDLNSISNISQKYISVGTEYNNFARRTIVCFNSVCPTPANNYDYINITPSVGLFDYGTVTFHRQGASTSEDEDNTYPYITKAGLYGAIFSGSPKYYSCQMSRALGQFEIKRQLIKSRLDLIYADLPESECKIALRVISENPLTDMSNPSLNINNITNMYIQSKQLDDRNRELELGSCPKIY